MSTDLVQWLGVTLVAIAAGSGVIRWLQPSGDLHAGLVSRFRTDGWPRGIQEEDGSRWTVSAAQRSETRDGDDPERPTLVERVDRRRVGRARPR